MSRYFGVGILTGIMFAQSPVAQVDEQSLLFTDVPSVLTASRYPQPITRAPASVDVITAEQIKKYGWRTVAAMLGSLPGFLATYDRAYHHVGVRGFAPPGDYNTRILVLIDGHRVNESLQDYAGLGQDFLVDVENIERVEVVRGPGSAIYGSSALFAVVNVITQRGRDLQGTQLAGELTSFDGHRGQVRYGRKYSGGLEALVSASFWHSDGHSSLSFPGLGKALALDGEQVERLFGKFAFDEFTLSGGFLQREKYLPTGTTGTAFGEPDVHYHDRRAYADLNYHRYFQNDWDVTGRLFWDGYEFDDDLPYRAGGTRILNKDDWMGYWLGGELLASRTFFVDHHLTAGVEVRYHYQQRMANFDKSPYFIYADNRLSSTVYGFFLQDEWALRDDLNLVAGGRYDHYDLSGGTFNPRLGLVYRPWRATTLKLLYGTAFRAPNTFETAYTCCAGSTPWIGNSGLKPERIETYELVLEQSLNTLFDLRFNAYYQELRDLIGLTVSSAGVRQFHNLGAAEIHGLEAQAVGHYGELEGRLSYSYQQARQGDRTFPPNVPMHMVKFNVSAPLWHENLYGGLEVQYVSRRNALGGGLTDGYTVTNLTLLSRKLIPGLEITGGLYNLFDQSYADPASPPLLPDAVVQDRRNLRLRLSYEF